MQAASPKCASGRASRSTADACSSCSRHSDRARPAGTGGRRRDDHPRLAGQPQCALAHAAGTARRAAAERGRGRIGARRRPLAYRLRVMLRCRPQRSAGTGSAGLAAGGAWTAMDVAEADRGPRRGTRALELFLTGETFDGARAEEIGLVTAVADDVDTVVEDYVAKLRLGAPNALAATKRLMRAPLDFADVERLSLETFAGEEAAEGMAAFAEKRPPRWAT